MVSKSKTSVVTNTRAHFMVTQRGRRRWTANSVSATSANTSAEAAAAMRSSVTVVPNALP